MSVFHVEDLPVNISSIANFLVTQAAKTAASLQQQNKESNNQGIIKPQREKSTHRTTETSRTVTPSSAYRVTISSAAMQKIAPSA